MYTVNTIINIVDKYMLDGYNLIYTDLTIDDLDQDYMYQFRSNQYQSDMNTIEITITD